MFDVVIAGGGPAGMSAALTLGRAHRTVLVLDGAGEGRNAPAEAVHNFLTRDGTPPDVLRRIGREELAAYGTVQFSDAYAVGAEVGFRLELSNGREVEARRLLLATGVVDDLPDLPGVDALWGRSAFHCPYCHGYECTGKRVTVIGAGPKSARLALQLSRFAGEVSLCTQGTAPDTGMGQKLQAAGIAVRCEPITRLEATGDRLDQVVFAGGPPLPCDAAFIENAPRQRSGLAARLGCADLPDGSVEVSEFGRTSVPGVYAAGDMARRATVPMPLASVITAAASGTVAGAAIDQDLVGADFDLPDPFAPKAA